MTVGGDREANMRSGKLEVWENTPGNGRCPLNGGETVTRENMLFDGVQTQFKSIWTV